MTSSNDLPSRIDRLESLEAIRTLKAQYAVFADRCLVAPSVEHARALADLFTDDATTDYGFFGTFSGKEALFHAFAEVLPASARWAAHHVMNPILSVDGDTAEGTWAFVAHSVPREPKDAARLTYFGSYEEKYRRVGGAWKIASIVVHFSSP
ncbi:nuclear transport factor 2 family protein [Polyangium mundeleinium]|uniref:Nuclear transport factor 2 family protein n=1 Tax=Polyangium mundeleinium TaxID=2995306 RepID=A0ABT5F546_9BACT|nr:nuclear transport factor 2 family protein [Polyangium mundeleinium]MDC0749211.1 nuclear transport factor 2 family protein [Polyangium mundeleinium]